MKRAIDMAPGALDDLVDAARWYERNMHRSEEDFLQEVARAVDAICEFPSAWPRVEGHRGLRARGLTRLPYRIIYKANDELVTVYAIAHMSRPEYWRDRVR